MLYPVLQDPLRPIVSSLFDRPRGASIGQMLFGAGEQGAWYDTSDMSTLFQDSAGTVPVTAVEQPVGRILDKSGQGNHATQATTTKRPMLSRRVNWLTKTEQFSDAVWAKNSGTTVSDRKVISGTGNGYQGIHYSIAVAVGSEYITRCRVRAAGYTRFTISDGAFSRFAFTFDLASGVITESRGGAYASATITSAGSGEFVITLRSTFAQATYYARFSGNPGNTALAAGAYFTGDGVSGVEVWDVGVALATDAHLPYQWVNTATDYDSNPAKFPSFARFDGVDDSLAVTVPNLGSSCGVAKITMDGYVEFLSGQTISGTYTLDHTTVGKRVCGLIFRETPFTPGERDLITAWGNAGLKL